MKYKISCPGSNAPYNTVSGIADHIQSNSLKNMVLKMLPGTPSSSYTPRVPGALDGTFSWVVDIDQATARNIARLHAYPFGALAYPKVENLTD